MKKIITLILLCLITVISCESTKIVPPVDNPPESDMDKYHKIKWLPVSSLSELEGTWEGTDFTIIYPYKIESTDYFLIRYNQTDDSQKWIAYANSTGIPLETVWNKRFGVLKDIYGKDYPLADENKIESGLKLKHPSVTKFYSTLEILIPEASIQKNINIFATTKNKDLLKLEGTYRYFSSVFPNETYDFTVLKKPETNN